MACDFDNIIDRSNTACRKWDQTEQLFGARDILPMWVADMDFQAPPAVVEAIVGRARHGIYGYTFRPQSYYDAIIGWHRNRHGWRLEQEWICASPGVISTLAVLVEALTDPGDSIVLQAPVYHSFYRVVQMNGRTVSNNPLRLANGRYTMDLGHLERIIDARTKLLLLCSPHNPVGRVWTEEELLRLGEICLRRGIVVISDEIHADMVFQGRRHVPFAAISESFACQCVTCTAPSKTFNLAGLNTAMAIIPDARMRRLYNQRLEALAVHKENCFAETAVESCYTDEGAAWLGRLLPYLQRNLQDLTDFVRRRIPQVKVIEPEGTYLVWLDCRELARELAMDAAAWKHLMYRQAGVAFNEGSMFGQEGEGFLRINIACPRSLLKEGLERFASAVRTRLRTPPPGPGL